MRPRGSQTLHAATSEAAADLGSVRIKYKYSIQTVLAAEMYAPFIEAISANRFQLPVVLGKVTNEREDAAWAIVRLFHFQDEGSKCIVEIAKHEVQSTGAYPCAVGRGKRWERLTPIRLYLSSFWLLRARSRCQHHFPRQLDGVQGHRRVHEDDWYVSARGATLRACAVCSTG